jgi:hypothetical protein
VKRLWISAALLLLLLAGALTNAWYAKNLTDSLAQQLDKAQTLTRQDDWETAQALTEQALERWQDHHFYLHAVLRHSDTDQIFRSFQAVLQYLDLQEMDQYAAANADLIAQLHLLAEMEQASVVNVL